MVLITHHLRVTGSIRHQLTWTESSLFGSCKLTTMSEGEDWTVMRVVDFGGQVVRGYLGVLCCVPS